MSVWHFPFLSVEGNKGGQDTPPQSLYAIHQVYLYKDVTNADIEKADRTLNGNWNILVFAEGGQVDGFTNAFEALNAQFGDPSAEGYTSPWASVK